MSRFYVFPSRFSPTDDAGVRDAGSHRVEAGGGQCGPQADASSGQDQGHQEEAGESPGGGGAQQAWTGVHLGLPMVGRWLDGAGVGVEGADGAASCLWTWRGGRTLRRSRGQPAGRAHWPT